jgi:hypothetical protein
VCEEGFARPEQGAACALVPGGLGDECNVDDNPCGAGAYAECHVTGEGSDGYCTSTGCESESDCEAGYMCEAGDGPSYCRRPPTGYGETCASDEDCEGNDASFCETLQSKVCLVPCAPGRPSDCFDGEVCCDLSIFQAGIICTPEGTCPTQSGG